MVINNLACVLMFDLCAAIEIFPRVTRRGGGDKKRLPNSMLGALIRKFWPGYYTPISNVPGGAMKLASTWADYEVAPCVGFHSAADAVITKFWVRYISRVSFLVDDPTVLARDYDYCFMHDCSAFIVWPPSIRTWRTRLCLGLVRS